MRNLREVRASNRAAGDTNFLDSREILHDVCGFFEAGEVVKEYILKEKDFFRKKGVYVDLLGCFCYTTLV